MYMCNEPHGHKVCIKRLKGLHTYECNFWFMFAIRHTYVGSVSVIVFLYLDHVHKDVLVHKEAQGHFDDVENVYA